MMMLDEEMHEYVDRKQWTRPWLLRREEKGAYYTIFKELAVEDTPGFSEYMRMPYHKFIELVNPGDPWNTAKMLRLKVLPVKFARFS